MLSLFLNDDICFCFSDVYCRSPSKTATTTGSRGGGSRKKTGGGWCGCLGGSEPEPPEITYCVADNGGGGLSLQAITPTTPMPEEEELNAKFAELVVSNKGKEGRKEEKAVVRILGREEESQGG